MLLCRNAWYITLCIYTSGFERFVAVKIGVFIMTLYPLTELHSMVIW